VTVASARQVQAAKRNVKKAQQAARRKRTIAGLPKSTRSELGKQAARGRQRRGQAGHALEDRNRQQLYEIAKDKNIPGRSKMGKWDLIKAIRKAG
jgi:Rho termination factor, N-terminal domain